MPGEHVVSRRPVDCEVDNIDMRLSTIYFTAECVDDEEQFRKFVDSDF